MSPRQLLIMFGFAYALTGCAPAHLTHDPLTQIDAGAKLYAENPSDYIDGEVEEDGYLNSDIRGTTEEMALIRQAQNAHDSQYAGAQSMNEDAIIDHAMTVDQAMPRNDLASTFHRVAHSRTAYTPDVEMHETRQHQPYLLDSGDRVRIFVYGQPNLSRTYNVDGGGFISVPLIGTVRARNITTHQLEISIGNLLATQYVKDPQVSVQISQYRPFFILGEVRRAGQYPFVSGMTVQTAVAIAGGYSDRAYEKSVKMTRVINGYRTVVKVAPHEPVYPGDTINVRERFF